MLSCSGGVSSVSPPSSLCPGSVQETTQLQIKVQQAESAKALSESMNKDLQVILFSHIIPPAPKATAHCSTELRYLNFNVSGFLKEDLADLKEQINLYENAVRFGVIGLEQSEEWENHLSESCVDLGLKKAHKKNGLHGYIMSPFYLYSLQNKSIYSNIFYLRPSKKSLPHCVAQKGCGSSV